MQSYHPAKFQFPFCFTRNSSYFLGRNPSSTCNQTFYEYTDNCTCPLNLTCSILHPGNASLGLPPDWYWVCGKHVYTNLTLDWAGTCVVTQFASHLSIVKGNRTHNVCHKRSTNDPTFPPPEHQLKTKVAKFWDAIFPQYGVTQLWNQIEVTHYRLATFTNETFQAMEGVRSELTALRLTSIQNRMALDMLLAEKGGVCAVIL
ncbi:hypothetical protein Q7C36_023034 [Tachysurus vachellii]|uniref:Uncharacterized protein n=1 Tax=Tachysurus vachellii TaxID=175792 RepID=A0AA88LF30_TACVA|nr:hypothetical protein Q7C36_023034 [Tachysurus vachellii]